MQMKGRINDCRIRVETISSGFAKARELNENMLTQSTKFNAQVSTNLLKFTQEWSEFVGMRLREDMQLLHTIQGCRSLPELQQACAQYWQTRLLSITRKRGACCGSHRKRWTIPFNAPLENGAAKVTLHQAA
jgi:hypothetical protein